jgi:hypothetical protein
MKWMFLSFISLLSSKTLWLQLIYVIYIYLWYNAFSNKSGFGVYVISSIYVKIERIQESTLFSIFHLINVWFLFQCKEIVSNECQFSKFSRECMRDLRASPKWGRTKMVAKLVFMDTNCHIASKQFISNFD